MSKSEFIKKSFLAFMVLFFIFTDTAFSQYNELLNFLDRQIRDLNRSVLRVYGQNINTENLSAIMVAPTNRFPYSRMDEIRTEGKLLGVFFTQRPFDEYGLSAPGLYAIELGFERNDYKVFFLDKNGRRASEAKATVMVSGKYYDKPIAFFQFGSPGTMICWDNICVEF